jgi:hypothetical protein
VRQHIGQIIETAADEKLWRTEESAGVHQQSTLPYAGICSSFRAIFLGQIWDNLVAKPCLFRPMEQSSVVWRNFTNLLKIKEKLPIP